MQKDFSLLFLCVGLCGEAGELANFVKKQHRDKIDYSKEIILEAGDVLWYLARILEKLEDESSLEDAALMNLEKLEL